LGDAFGFVAMPLLVFEATHSVVQMGYVTGITGAGQLLAATFSGVVVDRVNRRALMMLCDLARLALYGLLPLLAAMGALHMPVIYLVALLTALASNLYLVAYMAAITNLVEPHEVASANGRLQATQALTYVIGSALAGAVCARFGPAWAMGVNAISFAASAVTLVQIRFRRDRAERDPNQARGALREIASGLSFLVNHRELRALTLFQTVVALLGSIGIGAAVIDLVVFRLKVDLSETASVVGLSLALASVGAVLGALLGGRLGRRFGFGKACLLGTALQGVGMLIGGLGPGLAAVIVSGVFWSGGLTFRAVSASSLRQTLTPDALLGRVLAAGWTLIFAASALGAVLVTRAGAALGAGHAMALVGGLLLLSALVGTRSPLARATFE
jgi:MFS family permease